MTKWENVKFSIFWHSTGLLDAMWPVIFLLLILTSPIWWPIWYFILRDKTAWYDRYGEKIDVEMWRIATAKGYRYSGRRDI